MENKIEIYLGVFFVSFILFFIGVIALLIQYRQKQRAVLAEKRLMAQLHQQELLATQLEMQTQTMQHIGREIHDNVGQKLTLASLYTQQLAYENKAPQVNDKIESISKIINESLTELRQLSKSLTDDSIANSNITELLQRECEKVNGLKKSTVDFSCNKKNISVSYQTKSILLRIAQEFMQNSIKYADCKNITLCLYADDILLSLSLKDNGKGFEMEEVKSNGIGLSNMKKRTELLGGSFDLKSRPEHGTDVLIKVPLKKD